MVIVLESNSGIAQAEKLANQFEAAYQSSESVIIDGLAIKRIDTSVLQLLYSFYFSMKETGIDVSWKGASPELCLAADQLGLKGLLEL